MPRKSIEEIVARELSNVWAEIIESQDKQQIYSTPKGLCKTCDLADRCRMAQRQLGTWHCKDFE